MPLPLFQRRREREARAADAAAGNPRKLTARIDAKARMKIVYAMSDSTPAALGGASDPFSQANPELLFTAMRDILLREWGVPPDSVPAVPNYLAGPATDDEVSSMIEAWFPAMDRLADLLGQGVVYPDGYSPNDRALERMAEHYRETINEIFDDHDVNWQLAGREMIPRTSLAMHATVVAPVLSLLAGRPELANVELAFAKALSELKPGGDPTDAITDASTALQELLRTLGYKGEQLGPQFEAARKGGLVGPYDSKLAVAISALGDWVGADRSQRGDGHRTGVGSIDDAWLAVHVAGALILRLAQRPR